MSVVVLLTMSKHVLDASAVLDLLNQDRCSEHVAAALAGGSAISTVNLTEMVGKLADVGMPEEAIHTALGTLGLAVLPFDDALAYRAGLLRPLTGTAGRSLGDRACLALAEHLGVPAFTADRSWLGVVPGVDIRPIR